MNASQRRLTSVPAWIWALLAAALALQVGWKTQLQPGAPSADDLPAPPRVAALRIAAFGEPATLARLAMIYLQAFDYHGANAIPYRELDYERLTGWLSSIQALDPESEYPLFSASRVYAEVPDPVRQRIMLAFIHEQFLLAPNRRWAALAQAALIAKHRLKDLPLARRYAQAIDRLTTTKDVPLWAKQMEIFLLEDMNEFEAARVMLGGLLASGHIDDPAERRFLESRLKQLEERVNAQKPPKNKGLK